ncbi:DUF3993 domain-containing protein [Niallia nealsonii]|uniref:DUF3993 domain-containing protein n=1 Tax=Niallia nealsonii TaxID=115979 RepID=A0A2N0YY58_9BACI|nr:DUF3993 domain-containing protein [Niallia nealsonii]PKG22188.1 hypothetical protein CWS01_18780 [Niallia nealsonii]
MRKVATFFIVCFLFVFIVSPRPSIGAEKLSSKEEVMQFLKNAFYAQTSLTEKKRSLQEIHAVLAPYFTGKYENLFLQKNLVGHSNQYQTYGSDFAPYYIPFFDFADKTTVDFEGKVIYVYELFEQDEENPTAYERHYEGLLLRKEKDGWKVSKLWKDNEIRAYLNQKKTSDRTGIYWASYVSTLVFYPDKTNMARNYSKEGKAEEKSFFYF